MVFDDHQFAQHLFSVLRFHLQIVFREDFGTDGRGGYFDQYGYVA